MLTPHDDHDAHNIHVHDIHGWVRGIADLRRTEKDNDGTLRSTFPTGGPQSCRVRPGRARRPARGPARTGPTAPDDPSAARTTSPD
jgi:hypothetical protein